MGRDKHGGEPIKPAAVTITVGAAQAAAPAASPRMLQIGIVAVFTVLLLVAAWVVFVLPRQMTPVTQVTDSAAQADREDQADRAPGAAAPAASAAGQAAASAPAAPFAQAKLTEAREEAQAALEALLSAQRELEARAVTRWANDDYQAGLGAAAAGDQAYQALDYPLALSEYRRAQATFEELLGRAEEVLADALSRGSAALEAGDAPAASDAFALALAVQADNADAIRGAARAAVNEEVHALIAAARGALDNDDLDTALAELDRAAGLDADLALTQRLRKEVAGRIAERDFTAAMSRGYAALEADNYVSAISSFKRALAVRPGAREASEGLRQAQRAASAQRIETLLSDAAGHRDKERWAEAVKAYDEVLAIDGDVAAARSGRAAAAERLELERQMRIIIAAPERLASDAVHRDAVTIAARARDISPAGPRHAALVTELDRLLRNARTPVAVNLRSDGETAVEVYKVGAFGSFESHQLDLVPGRYVAIGTKPGFRDVRVEFMVSTRQAPGPVIVQCTEKI